MTSKEINAKLAPCGCGGKAALGYQGGVEYYVVYCEDCGACGPLIKITDPEKDAEKAAEGWNKHMGKKR